MAIVLTIFSIIGLLLMYWAVIKWDSTTMDATSKEPKLYSKYYCPVYDIVYQKFYVRSYPYIGDEMDLSLLRKGWIKDTEEEAQLLCDKLNNAIKDVK